MKRLIAALLLLLALSLPAQAEILPDLTLVTPMPTAAPAAMEFACEAFIVTLPAGMELMDAAALEAYEAAVEGLLPAGAHIQLAAVHPEKAAALCFALLESAQLPLEAAGEAALHISGDAGLASETTFGANSGAGFSHVISGQEYSFHFFSNGSALLMVCSAGLQEAQLDAMLNSLDF